MIPLKKGFRIKAKIKEMVINKSSSILDNPDHFMIIHCMTYNIIDVYGNSFNIPFDMRERAILNIIFKIVSSKKKKYHPMYDLIHDYREGILIYYPSNYFRSKDKFLFEISD